MQKWKSILMDTSKSEINVFFNLTVQSWSRKKNVSLWLAATGINQSAI